ncbi:MAG: hypothetical protein GY929_24215 [Actinomycetia bacterium]|nr:hypothetical protein [Actinomycetes bacterium]
MPPPTTAPQPVGPDGVPAPQTWLAIIDDRGAVAAVTANGEQRLTFSRPEDRARGISATIPAWSRDGSRLAWAETDRAEGPSVVTSRLDRRESTRDPLTVVPFYVSWNPTDTHIAVLGSASGGRAVGVSVSELADRNSLPNELDVAGSYYLSWAADGDRFLAHRAGQDLTVVDIRGRAATLVSPTGHHQAPVWLEDGRIIGVEATDRNRALVIAPAGQVIGTVLETDLNVGMVFTADPTGRWLAIQALPTQAPADPITDPVRGSDGAEEIGEILIVDLSDGRVAWRTGKRGQAWLWSPDGQSLLILTSEGPIGDGGEQLTLDSWVWNLPEAGSTEAPTQSVGVSFEPSERFLGQWLPFFDQHVQDTTLWAPDSSGWTFAGVPQTESGPQRAGVYVVGADPGDEPVYVVPGEVSVWAPSAGGGGGAAPSPA